MKPCYVLVTRCDFPQVTNNRKSMWKPSTRAKKIAKYWSSKRIHLCVFCDKMYCYESALFKHLLLHTQEKPFWCKICPSTFNNIYDLKRHIRIAHAQGGERPVWNKSVECPVCKRIVKGGLNRHLRTHTGETPYSCSICGKRFVHKYSLTSHMTIHTGVKPHSCEECGATFRLIDCMKKHILRVHRKERRFVCNICEATFGWRNILEAHIKSHLNEKQHKCEECRKWFSSAQCLRRHMERHISNRKTFKCSKCTRKYLNEADLKLHFSKKHGRSEDKQFACLFCDNRFSQNAELEKHVRISHIFEKPFPCQVCSEEFATSQQLKYHKRVHPQTARVYKCLECEKEFDWQASLASHMRFFHRRQQYICKLCHKSYVNPNNLNRHMKDVHKKEK